MPGTRWPAARRLLRASLLGMLLVLSGSVEAAAGSSALDDVAAPPRDALDVARRLTPNHLLRPLAPYVQPFEVGERKAFWLWDEPNRRYYSAQLRLAFSSQHFHFWLPPDRDPAGLAELARTVEERIWPDVARASGIQLPEGWRVSVVNASMPGGTGFFSAMDLYPSAVNPYSNQLACVYVNVQSLPWDSSGYLGVLAHELRHLANRETSPAMDTWVNEGTATLTQAEFSDMSHVEKAFLEQPDVQLDGWESYGPQATPHYGASELYVKFAGTQLDEAAFTNWVVGNLTDRGARTEQFPPGASLSSDVSQLGVRYVDLPPAASRLTFAGQRTVAVIPLDGQQTVWWSGSADWSDSQLTVPLDLRSSSTPVLRFRLWFDLQPDLDHGYLEVSPDGGWTWRLLPARYTSDANPAGNSYGPAYTGRSPGWVDELVHLSAYSGRQVLLRFEVITDDFIHRQGLAIHDLRLDNGASLSLQSAAAQGFRPAGLLQQRYLFGVVVFNGGQAAFHRIELDSQQRASVDLPPGDRRVAVVAGLAGESRTRAPFRLDLASQPGPTADR